MARIYLASSWRNKYQPDILAMLRHDGHTVYDFRNPFHAESGFAWSDMDENWQQWTPQTYRKALLSSPIAAFGFQNDQRAMKWADTCVLLLPCGRSAHLEAGWMAGAGKRCIVHIPEPCEPELMNLLADEITVTPDELRHALSGSVVTA